MTEPVQPAEVVPPPEVPPFTLMGDPAAEVCEDDACLLPAHQPSPNVPPRSDG